jgi:hypothetical protein
MLQVLLTEILVTFFKNYFYNFITFILSYKFPKLKSYIIFFINYFYNFNIFKLSFKYPKDKSY